MKLQKVDDNEIRSEISPIDGYPIEAPPGFALPEAPSPTLEAIKRLLVRLRHALSARSGQST
jgi:hypothetical protein